MITIYYLYSIDKHGRTSFHGRYGSKQNLRNAVVGLGLSNWFYEEEQKEDKYDLTYIVNN